MASFEAIYFMPLSPEIRGHESYIGTSIETELHLPKKTDLVSPNMYNSLPLIISTVDITGKNSFSISAKMTKTLGYSAEEWSVNPYSLWSSIIRDDDAERVNNEYKITPSNYEPRVIEYQVNAKNGEVRWIRDTTLLTNNSELQTTIQDITEEKRVREENEFHKVLLDVANLTHSSLELETVVDVITKEMRHFIDFDTLNLMLRKNGSEDEIEYSFTRGYKELKLPDPKPTTDARVSLMKKTLGSMLNNHSGVVIPNTQDPNSGWIPRQAVIDILGQDWLSYIGVPLMIKDGDGKNKVIGFLNLNSLMKNQYSTADLPKLQAFADQIANAVENARLHKKVVDLGLTDTLTELPNRRYLERILKDRIALALQHKHDLGICYFDLDMFSNYNDIEGRAAGDTVLTNFSKSIQSKMKKKTDFFGRWSEGEEFIFLFDIPQDNREKMTFFSDFAIYIQDCLMKIPLYEVKKGGDGLKHRNINWKIGDKIPVTACIGLVSLSEIKPPAEKLAKTQLIDYYFDEIVSLGDARAKEAKRNGRNRAMLPDGSFIKGYIMKPDGILIQPDIPDTGIAF